MNIRLWLDQLGDLYVGQAKRSVSCQVRCVSRVLSGVLHASGVPPWSAPSELWFTRKHMPCHHSISTVGFKWTSAPSTRQICLEDIPSHSKECPAGWRTIGRDPCWTVNNSWVFKACVVWQVPRLKELLLWPYLSTLRWGRKYLLRHFLCLMSFFSSYPTI